MLATHALLAFLLATAVFLLIPGPSVLFVIARSVEHGRRAGIVSVLGGQVGNLVHVLAATVGLSALLASSVLAFSVVKYLGAGYLIYLGIRTLLTKQAVTPQEIGMPRSLRRIFSQSIFVYALNPKTALFFLAFLPQFTDPSRGALWSQILFLGVLFVVSACVTDGLYALLAGTMGDGCAETSASGVRNAISQVAFTLLSG